MCGLGCCSRVSADFPADRLPATDIV
jgi:hypothetical protein